MSSILQFVAWRVTVPARDVRTPRRQDPRRLLLRRVLQLRAGGVARRRQAPARVHAGVPEERGDSRRDGRGDRRAEALLARLGRAGSPRAARRRAGRAVGDRADDRRRLHALRASGDRVPRRARAADARLDERAARGRSGGAKPILFFPARHDHSPRADRRRLRGPRCRRDRRLDGCAIVVVGRPRDRHGASRA